MQIPLRYRWLLTFLLLISFIQMPVVLVHAQTTSPLVSGSDHRWTFDEASGNRLDSIGALPFNQVGTVGSAAGKFATAAQFDNSTNGSNILRVADAAEFKNDVPWSWSFWFFVPAGVPSSQERALLSKGSLGGSPNPEWAIFQKDGNLQFHLYRSDTGDAAYIGVSVSTLTNYAGSWHHVVLINNPTARTITWCLDGVFATSAYGNAMTPFVSTNPVTSGFYWYFGSDGKLDEPEHWNRTLTPEEALALYNAGTGMLPPYTAFPAAGALQLKGMDGLPLAVPLLNQAMSWRPPAQETRQAGNGSSTVQVGNATVYTLQPDGTTRIAFPITATGILSRVAILNTVADGQSEGYPNAATFAASAVIGSDTTATQLTSGGNATVTAPGGSMVWFDLPARVVFKGQTVVINVRRDYPDGTAVPASVQTASGEGGSSTLDRLTSTSPSDFEQDVQRGNYVPGAQFITLVPYLPTATLAADPRSFPVPTVAGDSVGSGGGHFPIAALFAGGAPSVLGINKPGEPFSIAKDQYSVRKLLLGLGIWAEAQYGVNDLRGGASGATVEANMLSFVTNNVLYSGSKTRVLFLHVPTPITENPDGTMTAPQLAARTARRADYIGRLRGYTSATLSAKLSRNVLFRKWVSGAWVDQGARGTGYSGAPIDVLLLDGSSAFENDSINSDNTWKSGYAPSDGVHPDNPLDVLVTGYLGPQAQAAFTLSLPYPPPTPIFRRAANPQGNRAGSRTAQ